MNWNDYQQSMAIESAWKECRKNVNKHLDELKEKMKSFKIELDKIKDREAKGEDLWTGQNF